MLEELPLVVTVPEDLIVIYSIFCILLWSSFGFILARDFIRFQSICEREGLDDFEVLMSPEKSYPIEVKKSVKKVWVDIIAFVTVTVWMTVVGV